MSILIKDTTLAQREEIVRRALEECGGGGCENCSSCWLGGGSPSEIYADYIEGKRELAAFLQAKGKFMPAAGGFTSDPSKRCSHDGRENG